MYRALACDYDGTLATQGRVDEATLAALRRLRESGRYLFLVTGRHLPDLRGIFPHLSLFERVIAENGALLYRPPTDEEVLLGPAPPPDLVQRLQQRGVRFEVGRGIIASDRDHQVAIEETLAELGARWRVIFNKESAMLLPERVDKASGLAAALAEINLAPAEVIGVGDAENDEALLGMCGLGVAVANAIPALKRGADLVTHADHGAGVCELIELILAEQVDRKSGLKNPDPR